MEQADKFIQQFESGLATRLTSPGSAKTFATNWPSTAASGIKGAAGKILRPIIDYISAHKTEAPDVFMTGFTNFLGGFDLTDAFRCAFLPVRTEADKAAAAASAAFSPSKFEGIKLGTEAANLMSKAIKNIPGQKTAKVTATVTGKDKIDAINKALGAAKSKHITLSVSAQIGSNVQQAVDLASRFSGMGSHPGRKLKTAQHGMHEMVHQPTLILAGEEGNERVDIGKGGSGGGGGPIHVHLYLKGREIADAVIDDINSYQGVFK